MDIVEQMKLFMAPRSVAMIGASRNTSDQGTVNALECLLDFGYTGKIYPVNPNMQETLGLKVYRSVTEIPEDVDLAVISLPRNYLIASVQECIRKGIKAVIVVTQGFADADDEGKALQKELVQTARAAGVRIIGPNTMGVINSVSGFSSAFVILSKPERRLPVGFVGQSGISMYLGLLTTMGIPWLAAKGIDLGNTSDIDHADAIEYLVADSDTRVIALHLEGVNDGRRFFEAIRKAAKVKPVLALKAGVTASGARAAASHTGSLVGQDQAYDAALRQAGVIRAGDPEELEDLVKAFCILPPMQGNRIAILTLVGGIGVIGADSCDQAGVELASFTPETMERLAGHYPSWLSFGNPLDVWPAAFTRPYKRAFHEVAQLIMQDPNVDGIVAVDWASAKKYDFHEPWEEIKDLALKYRKPIAAYVFGPENRQGANRVESGDLVAAFPSPGRAVRALGALWRYQAFQQKVAAREMEFASG